MSGDKPQLRALEILPLTDKGRELVCLRDPSGIAPEPDCDRHGNIPRGEHVRRATHGAEHTGGIPEEGGRDCCSRIESGR